MPGTIVFKPIEANLNHDTDLIGKADPYCMFLVNGEKIKGQAAKSGGKHPIWNDVVTIPASNQPTCFVEIKDKDILKDDKLGSFEIDLREIEMQGRTKKWYPIFHNNKPAGEILMEAEFQPQGGLSQGMGGFGAAPIQSHGMPVQSHGMGGIGAVPIQSHGMPIQSHGMPVQSHGMPIQSHGMPIQSHGIQSQGIQSHGIPVTTHSTMLPVQTLHSHGMGGNVTQQTEIRTTETLIGAPMMQQQQFQGQQYGAGESLSEQYAKEALIRGVDPLGTHLHQYPGQMAGHGGLIDSTHPIPQSNLGHQSGIINPQSNMGYPNQGLPGQALSHLPGQQNMGAGHLPGQNLPPNQF